VHAIASLKTILEGVHRTCTTEKGGAEERVVLLVSRAEASRCSAMGRRNDGHGAMGPLLVTGSFLEMDRDLGGNTAVKIPPHA